MKKAVSDDIVKLEMTERKNPIIISKAVTDEYVFFLSRKRKKNDPEPFFFNFHLFRHHHKGDHGGDGHGHGHGGGGGGFVAYAFSGLVNGMLMFVFCCVFASLIFEACGETADFVPVGVSMHTITVFIVGGLTTLMSSLPCSIAGPDVNPALFFAIIAEKIVTKIEGTCSSTSHGGDDHGDSGHRFLAAAGGNSSSHSEVFGHSEQAAATIIFTIMLCTLILALTFFMLGYFNATRVVQFVPSCVLSGFLAVVGYKIMLKAIDAATGAHISLELNHIVISPIWTGDFWAKLGPAVPLGVTIYYLKKHHIGNPLVMLPTLLGVPLLLFYIVLLADSDGGDLGERIKKARADGWYYKEFKVKPFYEGFNTVYVSLSLVFFFFIHILFETYMSLQIRK